MNGDRAASSDFCSYRFREFRRFSLRFRYTTVRNGKGDKPNAGCTAEFGFSLQTQFRDFFNLKQANDNIDAFGFPPCNFVIEPIARPRPSHDRETTAY